MEAAMRYLDPRAALIGGASAAAAVAAGVSAPASFGIGVVTLVVANAGRIWSAKRPTAAPRVVPPERPEAALHPDERRRMQAAEDAVSGIRRAVCGLDTGPLRERLGEVATDTEDVLRDLRRLALQVAATRRASSQLDLPQLSTDLRRLTSTLERSDDPDVVRDLQRSVEAVREQLRVGRRLSSTRVGLQTRIEAGTLGLQQLAAQVAEMVALAPAGDAWKHGSLIDELSTQLDALRAGLSDAGAASRRVLGATGPERGQDDVPIAP
jgi:hypothetical protein